ncbi:MAG: TSUP family transporter [Labilithrix sp.]|nr:TSUP family transporter [Labilithrix sp.]MBX3223315.1 TSUP family transporter [Labilithrix sp.]
MTLVFLLLGLAAGVLTTIAGQGGGLLLLLACSALIGPHEALAITAPALLLGNLHRALLFRKYVDRPVAVRMIAGAVPGALAGGLLVGVTPAWALHGLLVVMTAAAIAKALGLVRFHVPRRALVPAGVVVGAMTGTSGGAGILFAPVLLSAGLTGKTFVATTSAVAVAAHVGRVAGYAGLGLFSRELIGPTLAVTAAIFAGNALGGRLHGLLTQDGTKTGRIVAIEYGTLVVCVALSVAGLG